jgi:hypothetical protein
MALRSVCFGVRSRKLSTVGQSLDGDQKFIKVLLRASEERKKERKKYLYLSHGIRRQFKPLVPAAFAVVCIH